LLGVCTITFAGIAWCFPQHASSPAYNLCLIFSAHSIMPSKIAYSSGGDDGDFANDGDQWYDSFLRRASGIAGDKCKFTICLLFAITSIIIIAFTVLFGFFDCTCGSSTPHSSSRQPLHITSTSLSISACTTQSRKPNAMWKLLRRSTC